MRIDYSTYSDEKIVLLLTTEKPVVDQAFYVLYHRYSKKINAYCRFMLSDSEQAKDAFQETWIKFNKSINGGVVVKNVSAFLISIARNLCIDQYKLRKKNIRSLEEISMAEIDSSFNECINYEKDELFGLIKMAVNSLDEIYKEAYILKKINGLSYKEMSGICGETVDCVKQRVKRATEKIKIILDPYIRDLSKWKHT